MGNKNNNTLAAPAKKRGAKKGMPTWVGTAILIAVIVVAALIVIAAVLRGNGTFKRMHVIAETENYKITVPMMSYLVYTEYQNTVSTYDQFSQQYGTTISIPGGTGGSALDKTKSLREQTYSSVTGDDGTTTVVTWFDHFVELARKDLANILACCEYARLNGIELEEADEEAIEMSIDNMELYAQYYGYTTSAYLASMYGEGVSKKDVRKMMELSELATKVNEVRSEEILAAITDADVLAKYESNIAGYNSFIDYIGYDLTATFTPTKATSDTEADKVKNEELEAKYEEKKATYLAIADKLNACTTIDEFKATLQGELQILFRAEEIEAATEKKGSELTEDEINACNNTADARLVTAMNDAVVTNYNTANVTLASEVNDWLKNTESPRAVGDKYKYESVYDAKGNKITDGEPPANPSTAYASATSTYAVYMTTSVLHRDESFVRSVSHILFKTDTFKSVTDTSKLAASHKVLADRILARGATISAKEMSAELITLMKEEGKLVEVTENGRTFYKMDAAVFEAYGSSYTEDSGIAYDNVAKGQMVQEFEDWMFDSIRVEGEVTTPYGVETDYGYHIMLYRGDEKPNWSYTIRNELGSGQYDEWLKAAQAETPVSYSENAKLWNMISG